MPLLPLLMLCLLLAVFFYPVRGEEHCTLRGKNHDGKPVEFKVKNEGIKVHGEDKVHFRGSAFNFYVNICGGVVNKPCHPAACGKVTAPSKKSGNNDGDFHPFNGSPCKPFVKAKGWSHRLSQGSISMFRIEDQPSNTGTLIPSVPWGTCPGQNNTEPCEQLPCPNILGRPEQCTGSCIVLKEELSEQPPYLPFPGPNVHTLGFDFIYETKLNFINTFPESTIFCPPPHNTPLLESRRLDSYHSKAYVHLRCDPSYYAGREDAAIEKPCASGKVFIGKRCLNAGEQDCEFLSFQDMLDTGGAELYNVDPTKQFWDCRYPKDDPAMKFYPKQCYCIKSSSNTPNFTNFKTFKYNLPCTLDITVLSQSVCNFMEKKVPPNYTFLVFLLVLLCLGVVVAGVRFLWDRSDFKKTTRGKKIEFVCTCTRNKVARFTEDLLEGAKDLWRTKEERWEYCKTVAKIWWGKLSQFISKYTNKGGDNNKEGNVVPAGSSNDEAGISNSNNYEIVD